MFLGMVQNSPAGAVLTMVVPLGIFVALLFWGFFQRKRFN
jgi:hypothetical protein